MAKKKKKHHGPGPPPPPEEEVFEAPVDAGPEVDDFTYADWESERQKLIDDVLELIREQKDAMAKVDVSGSFDVSPQAFSSGAHILIGPFPFETPFQGEPIVLFGQHPKIIQANIVVSQTATAYKPFIVTPYIFSWRYTGGAIDGFNVGLYNMSRPDDTSLATLPVHTINWWALGKGASYKDERVAEAWTSPGSYDTPDYLQENA